MVALKVIRPDLAGNQAIIDRFKQELLLATQVTHKNVIRIYDLSEADGMKFITMEYVEGEDLRGLMMKKQGSFRRRKPSKSCSKSAARWKPRTVQESSIAI